MLQLTSKCVLIDERLDVLQDNFATNHWVLLKKLVEPQILTMIQQRIKEAQWSSSVFEDGFSGTEFTLEDSIVCNILGLILNGPQLIDAIRLITGSEQVSEFSGRVYRMVAGSQHHLSWHNDIDPKEKRELGFSLNLSNEVFDGGTFELRDCATGKTLARVKNCGFGDAILFRISRDLEHRVTEVAGSIPKTACAGWFRATGANYVQELSHQLR